MTWIVGRGEWCCYVEEGEPLVVGGVTTGEATFRSEEDALRYAILCDEDVIRSLRENLKDLKKRYRKYARRAAKSK